MNRFLQEHGEVFQMTQVLRDKMLDLLNDNDLSHHPGGDNLTLGALCREMGEVQYSYIESFKTLKQDWSYRTDNTGVANSVSQLRVWFAQLDAELKTVMEGLSDEDLGRIIDRGFPVPVGTQLHIYREALLIFYGKAAIYLKALKKPLPEQWVHWIG